MSPRPNSSYSRSGATSPTPVDLAHEALAYFRADNVQPTTTTYLFPDFPDVGTVNRWNARAVMEVDLLLSAPCAVCAQGGLFYAYLLHGNDGHFQFDASIWDTLSRLFGTEQWTLIENCFEGVEQEPCESYPAHTDLYDSYANAIPDTRDRYVAVMENIIRNDGRFMPEQDLS